MLVLSDRLLITYGKIINSPRPLLVMATSDTTSRVSILFLWTGGSMCACHAAGPGSIPGWDKFPG